MSSKKKSSVKMYLAPSTFKKAVAEKEANRTNGLEKAFNDALARKPKVTKTKKAK